MSIEKPSSQLSDKIHFNLMWQKCMSVLRKVEKRGEIIMLTKNNNKTKMMDRTLNGFNYIHRAKI